MEPCKESRSRFHIQRLEDRLAPGNLTIKPASIINSLEFTRVLVDAPMKGLNMAEGHSNGVITWTS